MGGEANCSAKHRSATVPAPTARVSFPLDSGRGIPSTRRTSRFGSTRAASLIHIGGHDGDSRVPERRGLPRRDRPHHRRVERGLAGAGARQEGHPQRALGRPRRHRLRQPRLLRQPDRDAELRRARRRRPALQQHAHHGALLAEPRLRRHRAQPPQQRHGLHHRVRHRLPRLQRHHAVRERHALRDAARARLQHLHGRQVAPDAEQPGDGGRALRPLAAGARLRALLRLPRRRHQPVVSRPRLRQPPGRAAGDPGGGLPPHARPHRQVDRVHRRRPADRPRQALLPAPLLRGDARAAPRAQGVGRQVRGQVRRRLAGLPREDPRAPEGAGDRPRGNRSSPATTPTCPTGTRCPPRRASSTAA